MAKPDYATWDKVTAFSLREAAFLLCDMEPFEPTENHPVPPEVQAMMRQLNQGLAPDRDTGEREYYERFTLPRSGATGERLQQRMAIQPRYAAAQGRSRDHP